MWLFGASGGEVRRCAGSERWCAVWEEGAGEKRLGERHLRAEENVKTKKQSGNSLRFSDLGKNSTSSQNNSKTSNFSEIWVISTASHLARVDRSADLSCFLCTERFAAPGVFLYGCYQTDKCNGFYAHPRFCKLPQHLPKPSNLHTSSRCSRHRNRGAAGGQLRECSSMNSRVDALEFQGRR